MAAMLGKESPNNDEESEAIEEAFIEKYELDTEQFVRLLNDLIPFCAMAESPLTGKVYRGFALDHRWLAKHPM